MSKILSVTQLNRYVNDLLATDPEIAAVHVSGEISGYKKYPSGHSYFQLKDAEAQVSCVLFRGHFQKLTFIPEDGQKVIVTGRASIYEQDGRFQLVIYSMEPDGVGDLFARYEQLKNRLREEGLFDPEHKKAIPYMPVRIGVVTSPKGAVIRDIIHVLSRRFPGFRLTLYPSAVQGSGAAGQLRAGIRYFNEKTKVDVIIIGRGGGSIEDLWAFNDEELAREIYESGIPVISAVGHETDFTISDFVADLRAPTPSAAAELAVPDKSALLVRLYEYRKALTNALTHYMDIQSNKLRSCVTHRALISPRLRFEAESQRYDSLIKRLRGSLEGVTNMKSANCSILIGKLQALNPLSVLDRGYAIVTDESDCVITSVNSIGVHRNINIRVADGIIDAETRSIRQGGENGFRKL
ncbi:MAG: exodeoxyribonuclease VII large subunit [Clostridiaceae bacterium]|jgi:exodeoxyribonuclease VII large subunit|nr:exodeoxyribonuclease VII large subunit [Oscillospiraceae bacterium]NLO62685.1 exodeoxyribonuclease VII large subunit [Clostridiaceae bacterium]